MELLFSNKYAADRIAADKEYLQRNYLEITLGNEDIDSQMQDKSLKMFNLQKPIKIKFGTNQLSQTVIQFFDQLPEVLRSSSCMSKTSAVVDVQIIIENLIFRLLQTKIAGVQLTSVQTLLLQTVHPSMRIIHLLQGFNRAVNKEEGL